MADTNPRETILIIVTVLLGTLVITVVILCIFYWKRKPRKQDLFLKSHGNSKLNPSQCMLEQCDNLAYDTKFEFPRKKVNLIRMLGEGEFGEVWMATADDMHLFKPREEKRVRSVMNCPQLIRKVQKTVVAVKTLKMDATETDYKDLANELKILIHIGKHENIVNILGACTRSSNLLILLEYCPNGNLLNVLRSKRDEFVPIWARVYRYENLTLFHLTWFSLQVANAMGFLEKKMCVHRDLATRNVLVTEGFIVKVADFGLSRDIHSKSVYHKTTDTKLPLKWMAPETILHQNYTSKSDVWSFGILLWEIYTMGGSPYPGITASKLTEYLVHGKRMEKPHRCPPEIYSLMLHCWQQNPKSRPTFKNIKNDVDRILFSYRSALIESTSAEYLENKSSPKEGDTSVEGRRDNEVRAKKINYLSPDTESGSYLKPSELSEMNELLPISNTGRQGTQMNKAKIDLDQNWRGSSAETEDANCDPYEESYLPLRDSMSMDEVYVLAGNDCSFKVDNKDNEKYVNFEDYRTAESMELTSVDLSTDATYRTDDRNPYLELKDEVSMYGEVEITSDEKYYNKTS